MSIQSEIGGEDEEQQTEPQTHPPPAHHPYAPSDESFDISTTVDPSYIISLIRKLLPPSPSRSVNNAHKADAHESSIQASKGRGADNGASAAPGSESLDKLDNGYEEMDTATECTGRDVEDVREDGSCELDKDEGTLAREEAWEEYGCVLWDLAASKTHAELMVQNLVLEVLLANLTVFQSARITEISLGIIGNIACHETLRNSIASTEGLIEMIVNQLFLDDAPCLAEACRLLTLCVQGSEGVNWAEKLHPENVQTRILWIVENTLNPHLIEKSVGLLLAVLEGQAEVRTLLIPGWMKLGLPRILINLLAFEMSKLVVERQPERYPVTDLILRTTEALSVMDGYSQELCSNKELFRLLIDLIKLPDKIEVANCCVTAAVLIANMLTDAADLVLEISQDFFFMQELLDLFPFASDDAEARKAIWSIISKLSVQIEETDMSPSTLHQLLSVLVSKSELIEEELFDHELDDSNGNHESSNGHTELNPIIIALSRISSLLEQWKTLKDQGHRNSVMEENYADGNVDRLLNCCRKYIKILTGYDPYDRVKRHVVCSPSSDLSSFFSALVVLLIYSQTYASSYEHHFELLYYWKSGTPKSQLYKFMKQLDAAAASSIKTIMPISGSP